MARTTDRERRRNYGWAKTMIRRSNRKKDCLTPAEIQQDKGFRAGIRYAVASAGYGYHYDPDTGRYVIDGYPARNGSEGGKQHGIKGSCTH